MSLSEQITERVDDYLKGSYTVNEGHTIPTVSELTFGKTAKKLKCVVLYADLRGSKGMVREHGHIPAIRMHKCFLYTVTKCINNKGGFIRSFNGDSVLCFFKNNTSESARDAVIAAMNIKHALTTIVNPMLKDKYDYTLDFGIGIAKGNIYVAKSGFQGDATYQDLIWVGWPTYVAHAFGDKAKSPKNIWISQYVYDSIKKYDDLISSDGEEMWASAEECTSVGCRTVYKTSYRWKI